MDEGTGDESADRIAALEEALHRSREERERLRADLAARTAELHQRAAQMRRAEELARIGYWQSDLRTGEVIWSDGMSNLLGLPPGRQRRPGELYEYVHPEDVSVVHRAVQEALTGSGIYMAEFRARTVKGQEHHVRILGQIEFEGGRPVLNFGVGQDITPIRRAEAALRASEERCRQQAMELQLIYDTAPIGLCVLDPSLRFIHVNARLAQINGASVARHLGRTVREVIPAVADEIEPRLRQVLETGEPMRDFVLRSRPTTGAQGQRTWISQYWPLKDDGRVMGINVVVEEITGQLKLEESRRSELRFRTLAENSPDVISRFDRMLRRVYSNPPIEKVFGMPRDQLLGKTNRELGMDAELAAQVDAILASVFATGQPRSWEGRVAVAGGERTYDTRFIPEFGENGQVQTVLTISRDITERKRAEMALRESEERHRRQASELEAIYRFAPIGLAVLDPRLSFMRINERLAVLNGVAAEKHIGRTVREVVPAIADQAEQLIRRILETGAPALDVEFRGQTTAEPGAERYFNEQWFPLKDDSGRVWGVNVVVEDVTARKRAEEALWRREQEFEALAEASPDIIARYDQAFRLMYVNRRVEQITGKPRDWYAGKTPSEMGLAAQEAARREAVLREMFASGQERTAEYEYPAVTGSRYFQSSLVPERGPDGSVHSVLVVDRDITDLKRAQVALEELTLHDPLTGVANRRYLSRFIEREWRREVRHRHSVAVLMADIDFFKAYNDRYGHQRGDECLREVSQVLSENLRRPTDILVRYGGEEFAVVLLESDMDAAARLAETMQHAISGRGVTHEASPVAPVVTISLGVTAAPANTVSFAELLAAADQALYRAKQNGRNRVELARPARLHS